MSKVITNSNKIKEVLEKGVERVYPSVKALEKLLTSGKRIRLYCGFDPTAPSLHIGNAIQIRKLAQFQELGHEVIFLIGDFTAMIGDPTDKTAARKRLTKEQIKKNFKIYKKQASKILKFSGSNPAKIMFNSTWNSKLTYSQVINLAFNFTVQQMLARNMFKQRLKKDKLIFLPEFLYPLSQAYDSVAMNVDLEIGGNDQMFNMLRGRDLIRKLKNKEKFVLTTKLLTDPRGQKIGKTEKGAIFLDEKPKEMYGKIMAWPDSLIIPGFELCTNLSIEQVKRIAKQIKSKQVNPRDIKSKLARKIVGTHHGKTAAAEAEREFNRIFKEKKVPSKIKAFSRKAAMGITDTSGLMVKTGLASSKSEAKRLILQGAVRLDNKIIKDWQQKIIPKKGMILQVGKRRFIKLT